MRCSERGLGAVMIGVLIGGSLTGSQADSTLPEPGLRDRAVRLQEAALTRPRPAWLTEQQDAVATWSDQLRVPPPLPPDAHPVPSGTAVEPVPRPAKTGVSGLMVTILASRALGAAPLRELVAQAAGRSEVRVVFRGVAAGESLAAFIRQIHALLRHLQEEIDTDATPRIEIDPRPFQTPPVDLAPTLIVTDGAGTEIARVSGISRPDWLLEQVRQGRRGDLGVRGPTVAVSEPDLIVELQRRLAGIDWRARREAAWARYWARAELAELPLAEHPRQRHLDLSLTAPSEVALPDGTTVIRAGERVDPLSVMPFRQRLFIFDATDPRQVAEIARRGAASRAEGRLPLYLATRLERAAGWAGYRAVQAALGDPLYLLPPDVQRRFRIERVPAVVESREGVLMVSEWVPEG